MPRFEDFVNLSSAVYGVPPPTTVTVPTADPSVNEVWELVEASSLQADAETGYLGAMYFNSRTKEVVLVNRGTNDLKDLVSDTQMLLDQVPEQFNKSEEFYNRVITLIGNDERFTGATLSITGHSLGGSLTQLLVATHANDVINGSGVFGQTFNALGVKGLLDNLGLPSIDYAVTNWVVPTDPVGNLADHIGLKQTFAGLPFPFNYPLGPLGVLTFPYDSHKISQILTGFNTENAHPLLQETEEFLIQTYVTDPGFPIMIDGAAYIGGNNRENIGNELTGSALNDLMFGGLPDDRIHGGDGQDIIYAGAGHDTIWGDAGADILLGEDGNDTYMVDDPGDRVIETGLRDTDTVASTVSYALSANVEQLILQGSDAINGTGNALDNVLIGNNAVNVLDGGLGNDSMAGGLGGDILLGGAGFDTYSYVIGDGNDTIADSDARGRILYDTHPVDGGIRTATDQANTYHGGAQGVMTYVWAGPGANLTINDLITVQGFHDGDLGIHLTQESNLQTSPPTIDFSNTLPLRTAYYDLIVGLDNLGVFSGGAHQLTLPTGGNDVYSYEFGPVGNPHVPVPIQAGEFGGGENGGDPQNGYGYYGLTFAGTPGFITGDHVFAPDLNLWNPPGDAFLDLHLLGGDDVVGGGPGNDRLYGDDGADTLAGAGGNDQLVGGTEDEFLLGQATRRISLRLMQHVERMAA